MIRQQTPLTAEVARRMRALRLMRKMSARQFAEAITAAGCSVERPVLSNIENGRRGTIDIDLLNAAARALGVQLENLLPGAPLCVVCKDAPPVGFTCGTCHTSGGALENCPACGGNPPPGFACGTCGGVA